MSNGWHIDNNVCAGVFAQLHVATGKLVGMREAKSRTLSSSRNHAPILRHAFYSFCHVFRILTTIFNYAVCDQSIQIFIYTNVSKCMRILIISLFEADL